MHKRKDKLERFSPARIDAAIERGRAALAGAGRFESADLIRADREARDKQDGRR